MAKDDQHPPSPAADPGHGPADPFAHPAAPGAVDAGAASPIAVAHGNNAPPRQHDTPPRPPTPVEMTGDEKAILDHIREISQNARATWFTQLALLAFVGVTLLAHEDAHFFAFGVETQLPLVGISVPTTSFFWVAPLLIASLYGYLHVYLLTLWDALAEAPATLGAKPLFQRVTPTMIAHTAVWYRQLKREDGSAPPRALGRVMGAIVFMLVWLSTPVLLVALYRAAAALHDPWLSLWIAGCIIAAAIVGIAGMRVALLRLRDPTDAAAHGPWAGIRRRELAMAAILGPLFVYLGVVGPEPALRRIAEETGQSPVDDPAAWTGTPPAWQAWLSKIAHFEEIDLDWSGEATLPAVRLVAPRARTWAREPLIETLAALARRTVLPADLAEAELTVRPADWRSWPLWMEDFEKRWRDREGIAAAAGLTEAERARFETEAKERYRAYAATLDAPDLRNRDIRRADLSGAFLPAVDLRGAQIQGANLNAAELQQARLRGAQMQEAYLVAAQMQGADLRSAQMQGANLIAAQMQGADLGGAQTQGAFLVLAEMQGANLRLAKMQGADLGGAKMQGADLGGAKMQGADLIAAQMQGADLTEAEMQGADLGGAELQRAFLGGAAIVTASCAVANLRGAAAHEATILCSGLSDDASAFVTGNQGTRLPLDQTILSCLLAGPMPSDLAAALDRLPEDAELSDWDRLSGRLGRQSFVALVTCDPSHDDPLRQFPHTIHGTWIAQDDGSWRDTVTGDVYAEVAEYDWQLIEAHTVQWPAAREGIVVPPVPEAAR
ncbi:MAG: pentapeptide repeat-containing protein [Pseudomonadota bacterium]